MTQMRSLVAKGTAHLDLSAYVPFSDVVRQHIGGDLADRCKHIDGTAAHNLTSDAEISRHVLRFVGDYTDPDNILVHEDDVVECVRRFKKYDRQGD